MSLRTWFRPPRQILNVFLSVALVSLGTLVALVWLLVRQDRDLEVQQEVLAAPAAQLNQPATLVLNWASTVRGSSDAYEGASPAGPMPNPEAKSASKT